MNNLAKDRNYKIPKRFFHRIEEPLKDELIINIKLIDLNKEINYQKSNNSLRCMFTTEPIEHYPVSIPVLEFKEEDKTIYYCVDVFSTFEAAYTELKQRLKLNSNRDMYSNSERLLLNLFHEFYPDEELSELPTKNLLQVFNGPLTFNEYLKDAHKMINKSEKYKFVQLENVIEKVSDKKFEKRIEWL